MATFEMYRDAKKEFRWRLRADNQQIIATGGEGYKARGDCEHGIDLVKRLAPDAVVEDRSAEMPATI